MIENRYTNEIREICTEAINNFIKITDTLLDVVCGAVTTGNSVKIDHYSLFREHKHIVNQTEKKLNTLKEKVKKEQEKSREPEFYMGVLQSVELAYFELKMALDYLDDIYDESHNNNKMKLFEIFNHNLNSSISFMKSGINEFKSFDMISRRL